MRSPLAWRYAARELRAGVRGFRVFLACLALGVAAIAASGSVAQAFREGLAAQAGEILGGDLAVTVRPRLFTQTEKGIFSRIGRVAFAASAEAMAQAPSGARRLVEIRGVSDAYPLAGRVELAGYRAVLRARSENESGCADANRSRNPSPASVCGLVHRSPSPAR